MAGTAIGTCAAKEPLQEEEPADDALAIAKHAVSLAELACRGVDIILAKELDARSALGDSPDDHPGLEGLDLPGVSHTLEEEEPATPAPRKAREVGSTLWCSTPDKPPKPLRGSLARPEGNGLHEQFCIASGDDDGDDYAADQAAAAEERRLSMRAAWLERRESAAAAARQAALEAAEVAAAQPAAISDLPAEFDMQLATAVCSAGGLPEHLRALVKAHALAPPEERDAAMKAAIDALRLHNASNGMSVHIASVARARSAYD